MHESRSYYDVQRPIITNRGYKRVMENLALPEGEIKQGMTVLSVGEGLSDFARTLEQKSGARVVALDPAYATIHPSDTPEKAKEKLKRAGFQNAEVRDDSFAEKESRAGVPEEKQKNVAASVYDIPFPSATFDMITANFVLEHLNLERALPELLRVLKEGGEIRFGGPYLSAMYEENPPIVYLGGFTIDLYDGPMLNKLPGSEEAFRILQAHPEIQCFALVTITYRENSIFKTGTLVLKNGGGLPNFEMKKEASENGPQIGDVLKLDVQTLNKDALGPFLSAEVVAHVEMK